MLLTKVVKMKWTSVNMNHHIGLGYTFTKMFDEFEISVSHLSKGSNKYVDVMCDYCEKVVRKNYATYLVQHNSTIIKKDACSKCRGLKQIDGCQMKYGVNGVSQVAEIRTKQVESTMKKYGVVNVSQNENIKEKKKQSYLEHYGVDHYSKTQEYKTKMKESSMEKFGVEHHLQNPEIMQKQQDTNLERYGSTCVFSSEDIKDKIKDTNVQRYGFENVFQNKEINKKARVSANMSMYKNGTAPSSRQQRYIHDVLGGELNYPLGSAMHDVVFLDEKIILEYDGSGHKLSVICGNITEKEFDRKELKRNYAILRDGWKLIRIISNTDLIPSNNKLIEMLEMSKSHFNNSHSWIKFFIDTDIVETSQSMEFYDYGELRKITEKDFAKDVLIS